MDERSGEAGGRRFFQKHPGATAYVAIREQVLEDFVAEGYREVLVIGLDELPDVEETFEFDNEFRVGDLDDFPNEVEAATAQEARYKALEFLAVARFIEQRDAATEATR